MGESAALSFGPEVRVSTRAVIAATAVAGVVLGFLAEPLAILVAGGLAATLVELLCVVSWLVDIWHPRVSPWLAVGNVTLLIVLLQVTLRLPGTLSLLALPTALTAALVGVRAAGATAAVVSLLALASGRLGGATSGRGELAIALIASWSILAVMAAVYHPMYRFARWSWDHFREAQCLLEETRDRRAELKQALQDLAEANLQLTRLNRLTQGLRLAAEEAQRAKEQFVANVSHELRTPLNMIIGFTEMIMQTPAAYGRIPQALLSDLDVILRNSQHLASLIDDVLDLSQIEAGRMALTKERVALSEVVATAVAVVQPLFASKGLYLETEVAEGLPAVLCDRTRIREVLVNLLSNAGRFTERGGVRIRVWREGGEAVFAVADTGPGIAPEDVGKVFRPFQQLDGSIRRRHGGSGLGLSISRAFVELHGGSVWFESEKGEGTTFFFRLPIDPPIVADAAVGRWFSPYLQYEERTRRPANAAPVVRPRYVVLETHDALRRLVVRYLDDAEIVAVASLEEALQELSRVPAQALLINEASVPESLQRLVHSSPLPYGTPAIICSVPGPSDAADALGADGYLVKPVSKEALLAAMERLGLEGKKILVVDDDPEALQLFRRLLGSAQDGYRVLRASDGQRALDIMRSERPAALLLDLVMPGMDGFQLLAAKNEDPDLRGIPALVISARDPTGQPIITSALAVTRGGGLSMPQLLACIEALGRILGTMREAGEIKRKA